jgi:hypothetical protein
MKRYWIGWNEPVGPDDDSRPRKWPLPSSVIKYWKSGEAGDGSYHTLCAVVEALHARDAWETIKGAGWSPSEPVRFLVEKPVDWMPPADRFPA